jgi:hypothetical protein
MAAAIVECNDPAAFAFEEQNTFFKDGAWQQFPIDQFMIPRSDVPAIFQKHSIPP